ncbi:MAG: hypothetical protein MN733_06405, partial [Nitrososphaera sp.]|nr:hypothetical protein [Nitrososphaera sp.]
MPLANGSISVKDYDDETGITHLNLQDIDPAGLNYGSVTQDLDEIKDAVLTIIIGVVLKTNLQVSFAESSGLPTNQNAQRETKWLVTYIDQTPFLGTGSTVANPGFGKTFTFEIPCANLTLLANNEST